MLELLKIAGVALLTYLFCIGTENELRSQVAKGILLDDSTQWECTVMYKGHRDDICTQYTRKSIK